MERALGPPPAAPGKGPQCPTLPRVPYRDIPEFLRELRKRRGIVAVALEFALLTAERHSEARDARWHESDLDSELWTIPAADMLATGDVGLIRWVPLAQFDGPPEPIFQECRIRIDRDSPPDQHENLLAVTQILAGMRYNNSRLFQILGGREAMI